MSNDVLPGQNFPLGATVYPNGVNFCVFSKNCEAVELLLFDRAEDSRPARVLRLDPERNRTFYYWHIFLPNIGAGQIYGYRVYGQHMLEKGYRFDGSKVLLDPYGRAVCGMEIYEREAAARPGNNSGQALKNVVVNPVDYDWEGDRPLQRPYASTVIYEMHVAGFTKHPSSRVEPQKRGTYAGLIEKIPYLKDLGVTTVELLPVQQFDPQDAPSHVNYWGYSPIAFFAPHAAYASRRDPLGAVDEFRDMVKAFHREGIEVILDVVFNHTAEGDHRGPTLSFRGFENRAYYILEADQAHYANYSGCGNSLNANQSIVRRMIMDCLRYWVAEMHVDGFRFDLASVLARDEWGQPLKSPPILWEIESEPILAGTKIIAEAWDAMGLYQVGSFIGDRWAEWNGPFRDDVRRFIRGDTDSVRKLSQRITASPDLYLWQQNREPSRSINFITCHDGFTLNDLVSYNEKHNHANNEGNHDGSNENYSWNCGIEGITDDPTIETLRLRQIKNLLTILLVSQGTPMLLMGDEIRRSQGGNNNAYCQDNELGWFDWTGVAREADLLRFTREMVQFTQSREVFQEKRFWTQLNSRVQWHGVRLGQPDWDYNSHTLAFTLRRPESTDHLHIMLNAYCEQLEFELPPLPNGERWYRIVDTALASPEDFHSIDTAPEIRDGVYCAAAHSAVILMAH